MIRSQSLGLCALLLSGFMVSAVLGEAAANPPQTATAAKSGARHTRPKPASKTASTNKNKPFVIRETFREEAPSPDASRGVVGLDMLIEPGRYPVVQRVFKGTPAHRTGVHEGDTILEVNGARTVGRSLWEVDAMISDVPGDVVTLTLLRDGRVRHIDLVVMSLAEASVSIQRTFSGSLIGP